MTTRYLIERIGAEYRASCAELGLEAMGPTIERAVSALRAAISERKGDEDAQRSFLQR
jgi:hypothetical protein